MLNHNVRFTEEPAICYTSALPDGTYDVWLRKGIHADTVIDENGDGIVEYIADEEAYARTSKPFTILPGDPGYDDAYAAVAAWEPGNPGEKPDELKVLREKVDKLAASNEMLTECIMEMSEIIYA